MIDILRKIDGVEQTICKVASDNATVVGEIMAREEVNIDVVVDAPLNLAVGDYVRVDDTVYTLNRETRFDKKSEVEYRYDLLFESPLYRLLDKLFVHPITGLSTFTISRTLAEWLKLVVDCINEIDPGWTIAIDIPDTEPKNLVFESASCREGLNRLVSEFGVEFFLIGKEIHFVSRIENVTGLVFEQGKGKGLYSVSQEPVDTENTITRIFPYGGSQNVAPGEGDAKGRLCLPEKYLENFSEYSKVVEKEVEFTDIFPRFTGSADSVSGEFNKVFRCAAINFDVKKQAIGDTPVKINILTGDLMGESFEFGWKNETKEITLIRKEDETALPGQDGKKPLIPSESRKVKAGDSFNLTDLNMPTSYKDNAVIQLRKKATEWLAYYSRSRVKFALEVDHRYLRGKHVLKAGDLVTIKIPETGIEKLLRITSIERNLNTGKINCTVSNYLDEKWEKKIEGAISDLKSTVAGGGNAVGGGSTLEKCELSKSIIVNSPKVGHIDPGKIILKGTTLEQIFRQMLYKPEPATLIGKISTSNDVEIGSAKGVLSYTATRNGNGVMLKSYFDGKVENILKFTEEVGGVQTATRQLSGIYTANETYIADVVYAASEGGDLPQITLNSRITVNVRRRWFAGVCNTKPASSADVRSLSGSGFYMSSGTYKFSAGKWKMIAICIPEGTIYDIGVTAYPGNFIEDKGVCSGPTTISVEGANGSVATNYKMWLISAETANDPDTFTFKTN